MNQFLVLSTFTDHIRADAICGILEEMKIPVILEHVELNRNHRPVSMIRLLVPSHCVQRANAVLYAYETPRVANLH